MYLKVLMIEPSRNVNDEICIVVNSYYEQGIPTIGKVG